MRSSGSKQVLVAILCLGWLLAPQQTLAAPLDLGDDTPRWIEVRFEISPADQPGSLDRMWSVSRPARLEPRSDDGVLLIRIPAEEVEAQLRSTGTDAIAGTFSEFVWTLDPETGHVVEAGLTGRVREEIRLGPFRSSAQVEIRVDMNTNRHAGFDPGHGILGVRTNRFCAPAEASENESGDAGEADAHGCVSVAPVLFDPTRGYVNAVGTLRAASPMAVIRAFSPLGEVQFSERTDWGTEAVVSGPIQLDAVCSEAFEGPCRPDLGGES